jgi:Cu/Ag efflux protein CusF
MSLPDITVELVENDITVSVLPETPQEIEIAVVKVVENSEALLPDDIGVTVQPYNANTVIDPDYNTFTDAEKTKLEGIESGAQVNPDLSGYVTDGELTTALANYQPLATVLTNTTASFTTDQETKLAGIAEGAEVNVNADWNAVSGDAQILNKPTLGTAAATNSTDYATAAQGTLADTALQPDDIGITVQGYNAGTVISNPTGITGADVVTNIVSLTQAEYDAISAPNPSTLYVITD